MWSFSLVLWFYYDKSTNRWEKKINMFHVIHEPFKNKEFSLNLHLGQFSEGSAMSVCTALLCPALLWTAKLFSMNISLFVFSCIWIFWISTFHKWIAYYIGKFSKYHKALQCTAIYFNILPRLTYYRRPYSSAMYNLLYILLALSMQWKRCNFVQVKNKLNLNENHLVVFLLYTTSKIRTDSSRLLSKRLNLARLAGPTYLLV